MYNRYIPQPDGTYRRHTMHDKARPKPPEPVCPPPEPDPPCPPPKDCSPPRQERRPPLPPPACGNGNILGFFKNLLPRELDTADLMIIILLLLMAGDCADDKNTALLTLALYFLL